MTGYQLTELGAVTYRKLNYEENYIMNLTSDTVAILKNFSDINQNILVKPGNQLQTISTLKNILAQADVTEKFDQEFAIYDLPEFLRAVDLFDKSELNLMVVKI